MIDHRTTQSSRLMFRVPMKSAAYIPMKLALRVSTEAYVACVHICGQLIGFVAGSLLQNSRYDNISTGLFMVVVALCIAASRPSPRKCQYGAVASKTGQAPWSRLQYEVCHCEVTESDSENVIPDDDSDSEESLTLNETSSEEVSSSSETVEYSPHPVKHESEKVDKLSFSEDEDSDPTFAMASTVLAFSDHITDTRNVGSADSITPTINVHPLVHAFASAIIASQNVDEVDRLGTVYQNLRQHGVPEWSSVSRNELSVYLIVLERCIQYEVDDAMVKKLEEVHNLIMTVLANSTSP